MKKQNEDIWILSNEDLKTAIVVQKNQLVEKTH